MPLVFNEKQSDEGIWTEEYDIGVRVKVLPLDKPTFRKLKKQASGRQSSRLGGRRQISEVLDDEKFDHLLYRHIIKDWEGINDSGGNSLPCTDENKCKVTDRMMDFAAWILEEAFHMSSGEVIALEDERKNS